MKFFRLKKDRSSNIIDEGTTIAGHIQSENSWTLSGTLVGNLTALGDVFIKRSAEIHGDISGMNIWIAGKVNGNIYASMSLHLASTSSIAGDIHYQSIEIEEGASYFGNMNTDTLELEDLAQQVSDAVEDDGIEESANLLNKEHYTIPSPKSEPAFAMKNKRIMIQ